MIHEGATSRHLDSLAVYGTLGRVAGQVACLEGLAAVAAEQRRPERAARLLGAATALREGIGIARRPSECTDHEHTLAMVRDALGADAFGAAWAAGWAMPLERAIAFAGETATADRPSPG